jgi:hypothetical protein
MSIIYATESNQSSTLPPPSEFLWNANPSISLLQICFKLALSPHYQNFQKFIRSIPPIQEGFPSHVYQRAPGELFRPFCSYLQFPVIQWIPPNNLSSLITRYWRTPTTNAPPNELNYLTKHMVYAQIPIQKSFTSFGPIPLPSRLNPIGLRITWRSHAHHRAPKGNRSRPSASASNSL